MDKGLCNLCRKKAMARHARIGIGIWNSDETLIASLQSATKYADLLLVGEPRCKCDLEFVPTDEPWRELVRLLKDGKIDGAVRGNLPAGRAMKCLARQFDIKVKRLALLELSGWSFLLGPVGIDEGEAVSERLGLAVGGG